MTCEDCQRKEECKFVSEADKRLAHKMWMIEFWGNAEERCKEFLPKENSQI